MQDRCISPELFSTEESDTIDSDENRSGINIYDLYRNNSPWNFHSFNISPNRHHTILFEMPVTLQSFPKPHVSANQCYWDLNHVKMPFSSKNVFPVKEGQDTILKERWGLIQCKLLRTFSSSYDLEEAIFSYNLRHQKFHSLHYLFEDMLTEDESLNFFNSILPEIISLALQLPELIQTPIPLLKQGKPHTLSLSQKQIASLLANAFLCTFPWRKENVTYPGVNFNRLFECGPHKELCISEKIKCILHYFRRVCEKTPTGVVTFERKHIPRKMLPRWDLIKKQIGDTKLHVSSIGTIEDDGLGLLQVDFANSMVGGGVLGWGCVQEEIRFAICPEMIISRLFTEQLGPNEALLITGAECFSKYKGYADSFEWAGNCDDTTPFDESGRRQTSVVAIDALYYSKPSVQFSPSKMIRELNKAYVGFYEHPSISPAIIAPIATGNWGCGAFRGNTHLKALLQIMACTAANRNIVYYTFGDKQLKDAIFDIYNFLANHQVTVEQLWNYLCKFNDDDQSGYPLLTYIKHAHTNNLNKRVGNGCRLFMERFVSVKKPPGIVPESPASSSSNQNCNNKNVPDLNTSAMDQDMSSSSDSESELIREILREDAEKTKAEQRKYVGIQIFCSSSDEEVDERKDKSGFLDVLDNIGKTDKT